LASYGGNLSFNIQFEGPSSSRPKKLEVRLSGARVNLVYSHSKPLYAYETYKINIPLFEVT
jgi:hypothetical protein